MTITASYRQYLGGQAVTNGGLVPEQPTDYANRAWMGRFRCGSHGGYPRIVNDKTYDVATMPWLLALKNITHMLAPEPQYIPLDKHWEGARDVNALVDLFRQTECDSGALVQKNTKTRVLNILAAEALGGANGHTTLYQLGNEITSIDYTSYGIREFCNCRANGDYSGDIVNCGGVQPNAPIGFFDNLTGWDAPKTYLDQRIIRYYAFYYFAPAVQGILDAYQAYGTPKTAEIILGSITNASNPSARATGGFLDTLLNYTYQLTCKTASRFNSQDGITPRKLKEFVTKISFHYLTSSGRFYNDNTTGKPKWKTRDDYALALDELYAYVTGSITGMMETETIGGNAQDGSGGSFAWIVLARILAYANTRNLQPAQWNSSIYGWMYNGNSNASGVWEGEGSAQQALKLFDDFWGDNPMILAGENGGGGAFNSSVPSTVHACRFTGSGTKQTIIAYNSDFETKSSTYAASCSSYQTWLLATKQLAWPSSTVPTIVANLQDKYGGGRSRSITLTVTYNSTTGKISFTLPSGTDVSLNPTVLYTITP